MTQPEVGAPAPVRKSTVSGPAPVKPRVLTHAPPAPRGRRAKLRDAVAMFCIQVVAYLLATLNFRVVQTGSYAGVAVTDALLATFGFLVVRRVARSEEAWHLWLGYMLGGVVGGVLGLALSLWIGT